MISLTTNLNNPISELTRIIVPANGRAPSIEKVNHLSFGSVISNISGTIWKQKNTIIISYMSDNSFTFFDFIEINEQIGTPIVKN